MHNRIKEDVQSEGEHNPHQEENPKENAPPEKDGAPGMPKLAEGTDPALIAYLKWMGETQV